MKQLVPLTLALVALAFVGGGGIGWSAAAPVSVSSYQLRPDDVIEITVLGMPQLDKTVTILPDGTISYPRLGTIHAAGMTPDALRLYLYKELDRFYNNLQITVTVRSLRIDQATVNGAVRNSGLVTIRPGWTVRELLAAAGGIAVGNGPPEPDQMRATLIRKSGERLSVPVAQLLSEQPAPDLPAVEPDDVLLIEDLAIPVWVDGEVAKPGPVTLPPGGTALDALRMAGGETDKAALTKAYIRRGMTTISVNLRPFASGAGGATPPPALERNDTLHIPENKDRVLVWGGVNHPGGVVIPENETLRLTDAITLAGGSAPRAGLQKVVLVPKGEGASRQTQVINVQQMLKTGDLSQDVVLHPGDWIYVPDPRAPSGINPLSLLQYASIFAGIF